MAFPPYVQTRVVSAGGAMALESSQSLRIVLAVQSTRSLVWDATGYRFQTVATTVTGEPGAEVTIALPRTDVPGWRDGATGAVIDVSSPDSHTHTYNATLTFLTEDGKVTPIAPVRIGPFVVPAGDGPIDLDRTVPVGTVAGQTLAVPDTWSALVAASQQAVLDVQEAVAGITMPDVAPVPDTVAQRDGTGALAVGEATAPEHAVSMGVLDDAIVSRAVTRRAPMHSQFTHVPDGQLPAHTDTGQPWGYLSAVGMEVRGGFLRSKAGSFGTAPHAEVPMGDTVVRMGAEFRFSSEGGTRTAQTGTLAINAWADGGIAANGGGRRARAHLDLTQTSMGLGVRAIEGVGEPIDVAERHTFAQPLAADTWYTVEWHISGDKAVVLGPDGFIQSVTDPRFTEIAAEFADFQLSQVTASDQPIPEFARVWAEASEDIPDETRALAVRAAHEAAEPPLLLNNKFLRLADTAGELWNALGMSTANTVILRNGRAPSTRGELQLGNDGGLRVVVDGVTVATVASGLMHFHGKVTVAPNGVGIFAGADASPVGIVTAPRGSIYISWNSQLTSTEGVWVKTSSTGSNGWHPVGHPTGTTAQRPAAPVAGVSYFDKTLGKPIWYNGTAWVDATGTTV